MIDYNIDLKTLVDIKGKKINPWREKKIKSILLSESYYRLQLKKFDRVSTCSDFLEFYRYTDNTFELNNANFCKDRLCPMCAWRRSLKIFGQTSKILNYLENENEYRFLFLTLTLKNCFSDDLSQTIDDMFYGYKKMFQTKRIKKMCLGTFRALEITHNKDDGSFHPHFHIIICVKKSYFKDTNIYINHSDFKTIWKTSMKLGYDPQINIKAFKQDWKGVAEASKYSVKDSDFITDDINLTDKLVSIFDSVLKNRRLVAYSGLFRKAHKTLNLDDFEYGDLISDNDTVRPDLDYIVEIYNWNIGIGNYTLYNK